MISTSTASLSARWRSPAAHADTCWRAALMEVARTTMPRALVPLSAEREQVLLTTANPQAMCDSALSEGPGIWVST